MESIPGPVYLVLSEAETDALGLDFAMPHAYVTQTALSVNGSKSVLVWPKPKFSDIAGPETKHIRHAPSNGGRARELRISLTSLGPHRPKFWTHNP